MCLQQGVNDAGGHSWIKFGECTSERVEAVAERAPAKRRPIDTHRAVGDHGIELALAE